MSWLLLLALQVQAAPRPAAKGLSMEEALGRSSRVSAVRYDLEFSVDADSPAFSGKALVSFKLKDASRPLTLDFTDGRVLSLEINGRPADPDYNGFFLTLPAGSLAEGENRVTAAFSHPYSKDGRGLIRSKDPADGRSYLYTDFEPYDANLLFPGFDQPDLKAPYSLAVEAPGDWLVISAARESEVLPAPGGRRRWVFPRTAPMSTYVYSLHAGPYAWWSSSAGDIPLRLFARQSLAPHVEVDAWFKATKQGFEFFNKYFAVPYPFGKYDQLIVPDFLSGAMENVAAVTFSENLVWRGTPTWRDRMRRSGVILHEMAHMWFGNLVTMRWWDDLWLNESFASYMANLALKEATEFSDSWLQFYTSDKLWAYWEDQLVTTHPIEAQVPDTEQAFANFDGITYGKGGSVLKLVSFQLGAENFRDGVRRYLKDFSYGNATRKDFIEALDSTSLRSLDGWTKDWLQTAGVNTARAEVACRDGKISSFKILQGGSPLRPHATRVALYERREGGLAPAIWVDKVDYEKAETRVSRLEGKPCPDLVLLNAGDHDYAKVVLDPASLKAAKEGLSTVADPLDRALLWMTLWQMTRDAELSVGEWADLVLKHLPAEREFLTMAAVAETLYGRRVNSNSVLGYLAGEGKDWTSAFSRQARRFEDFFLGLLEKAEPAGDAQRLWFDSLVRTTWSPEGTKRLKDALSGAWSLPGLSVDQDRRWEIVAQLSRVGAPGAAELAKAEKARDGSRRGEQAVLKAEALRPDLAKKKEWFSVLTAEEPGRPFEDLRTVMRHLFPPEQSSLRRAFAAEFYAGLKAMAPKKPNPFLDEFSDLAPVSCRPAEAEKLSRFLAENPKFPPAVDKSLKIMRQEDGRCQKIRALAARAL